MRQNLDKTLDRILDPRVAKWLPTIDIGCFVLTLGGIALIYLGLQGAEVGRLVYGIVLVAIFMPVGIAAQVANWHFKRRTK